MKQNPKKNEIYNVNMKTINNNSNERKINFNDMHPEIDKVEEKKYIDIDLLKHRTSLSKGSRQREATSNKK